MGIRIEGFSITWEEVTGFGERPQFVPGRVYAYGAWTGQDGTRLTFETDVTDGAELAALTALTARVGERVATEMAG